MENFIFCAVSDTASDKKYTQRQNTNTQPYTDRNSATKLKA